MELMAPVFAYWKGKTLRDKCMGAIPEYMKQADQIKAIYGEHLINEGSGHLIVDFPQNTGKRPLLHCRRSGTDTEETAYL